MKYNPIRLYLKLDAYLIARLNKLYLWALDWTGIYVGTILFLILVPSVANMIAKDHMSIAAFIFLCVLLIAISRYIIQGMSPDAYNKVAIDVENGRLRHFFLCFNFMQIVQDFIIPFRMTFLDVSADVGWLLVWYLLAIKIRKRDPKEFKIWKLAPNANT